MRVAIDARKLRDGGIGTYIRELVRALAERPDAPHLLALLDHADLGRTGWPDGAVDERPVRAGRYGFWEHVVVPRAAWLAGASLLHAPHYTLPLAWGGPAIVTIHDLIHLRHPEFFPPGAALYARTVAGAAARRAALVLVDSIATRDDVVALLPVKPDRVRVVPLGVSSRLRRPAPATIEAFRSERGLPADYLLYVGARKRHKNLALLLEALAQMAPGQRPMLVLAGDAWPPEDPLARLAARVGVIDWIVFTGAVDGEVALSNLYAGATLYVQPSLIEGFGLPPLEAMACGTPVLSSNAAALLEAVGDAAVVLPPKDPEAWAAAIARLLGDPQRRADLSRRGLERAAIFTWEKTAAATLEAYKEALA